MSRRDDFEIAQAALIAEYADVLAPRRCSVCEPGECHHTIADGTSVVVEGVYPNEWVLVHQWADLNRGGGFWDVDIPRTMVASHALGLLMAAKNDMESAMQRRPG